MAEEKKYPAIEEEIKKKNKMLPLRFVDENTAEIIEDDLKKEDEQTASSKSDPDPFRFAGYDPNVIDFIRRCDKESEALEIIDYLEKKEEITEEQAISLRKQLVKDGLRSFGSKKNKGFYFYPDD